jgi:hypothetical protein
LNTKNNENGVKNRNLKKHNESSEHYKLIQIKSLNIPNVLIAIKKKRGKGNENIKLKAACKNVFITFQALFKSSAILLRSTHKYNAVTESTTSSF